MKHNLRVAALEAFQRLDLRTKVILGEGSAVAVGSLISVRRSSPSADSSAYSGGCVNTHHGDEIVVVGAGSVGSTIAFELSQAGFHVRLLDAGTGPGAGCSYANAGLLSPSHVESMANLTNVSLGLRYLMSPRSPFRLSPRWSLAPWLASFLIASRPRRAAAMTKRLKELARQSLALHLAYPDRGVATGVTVTGSLDVYSNQGRWSKVAETVDPAHRLSPEQVREAIPGLRDAVGGVRHDEDATCNTLQYVTAMVEAARGLGAVVQWNTKVVSISATGGRIVSLTLSDGSRLRPSKVVLAAGLGTTQMCAQLGIRVPMQPATGYVIDVPVNQAAPSLPVTLKEAKVVVTPFADRLRAAGTLDLSGRAGLSKPHRLQAVRSAAASALPTIDWCSTIDTWSGDRPSTSDGMPVIGTSQRLDGLVVATGHGMWGLILAPITAMLVRDGIMGKRSALTEAALSPDRFTRALKRLPR